MRAIAIVLAKLFRQAIDRPRKNMYCPQEKGKVREKLATNVTIVVVTLSEFTSSRGVVKDFTRNLLAEYFLERKCYRSWGHQGGRYLLFWSFLAKTQRLRIVDRTFIQRCFYMTTGEEFHKSLKLCKNSTSLASFSRQSPAGKCVEFRCLV